MDVKDLYLKADGVVSNYIENLTPETEYTKDSILPEWSIHTLLNHLVNETLWLPDLLEGKTISEVGDKYEGDLLGDDPKKAWRDAEVKAHEAIQNLDDLEKEVHLSFGDFPAKEYLSQMILDKTIHGWDLAKSTNQDDTLPEDLLQFVWEYASKNEADLRASGVFGEKIEVPEDADIQTKVLALLGRKR